MNLTSVRKGCHLFCYKIFHHLPSNILEIQENTMLFKSALRNIVLLWCSIFTVFFLVYYIYCNCVLVACCVKEVIHLCFLTCFIFSHQHRVLGVFKMCMKCKRKIKQLTLTCPWLLNSKPGDKCLKYPQKFYQFRFLSQHTSYFGTDSTIALKNK